jgi:hypothetical protein
MDAAHSMIGRRRDDFDSADCYAMERSSKLDGKYAERVDGDRASRS